ncbi:MAG: RNA methyltransferase [Candidatus Harrisonbacteria bacterium CG10_big_fil_rev_8_21_14_0_10_44_23]|uniref:RNA methyltransferase n=1 Tax=Candidatus Harrisonbacteria bacterium CG10_big_fil_rev_8_21_14_0_10_44_23 TaxID=1974585 RepID=A0A2H0UQ52_9BACT|nr:MAG: RNA methyltransferase [Candidatus Harrisonbacteria bacterium CG10_big_fil_rev_8_21_14_0_10_44_23]
MIAILHNIRSLHNVGSIFRTADGAGVEKLYLGGFTPGPYDRVGILRSQFGKTALGAEEFIDWELNEKTPELMEKLKNGGFKIVAVELDDRAVDYRDLDKEKFPPKKTAFIFGHEVDGVPKDVLDVADAIVKIPMHGRKESLNVSVAFGVIAFEFSKND